MEAISDAELFDRARAGDDEAFGRIVDRHKDALVNYLTRMSGCPDRAQDLAQEAFLRLYERSTGYREEGHLKAYLFRIATNLVIGEERKNQRRRWLSAMFLPANGLPAQPTQERDILRRELGSQLAELLAQLPPKYRVPVVLRDVEDWTYEAIASLLRCRLGTVKSRIHRGRRMLRSRLEPYLAGSEP